MNIDLIIKQLEAWQAEDKENRSILAFYVEGKELHSILAGYDTDIMIAIESAAKESEPISDIIIKSATNIALGDDSPTNEIYEII